LSRDDSFTRIGVDISEFGYVSLFKIFIIIHMYIAGPSALLDFEYGRNCGCGCKQSNWIYDGCILFFPLFIGILQLYFFKLIYPPSSDDLVLMREIPDIYFMHFFLLNILI
jgi:hypothetical protein